MHRSPEVQSHLENRLTASRTQPFVSRRTRLATALLSMLGVSMASLAHAAPGGNTGGEWYAAGNACSPSPNVNSYGGKCATTDGGDASDAHVVIVDETPGVWSYGGYVLDGVSAEASRNTVVMRSGEVSAVFGARALGGAQGSVANDNGVFIEGGQAGSVYGAQSNVGGA